MIKTLLAALVAVFVLAGSALAADGTTLLNKSDVDRLRAQEYASIFGGQVKGYTAADHFSQVNMDDMKSGDMAKDGDMAEGAKCGMGDGCGCSSCGCHKSCGCNKCGCQSKCNSCNKCNSCGSKCGCQSKCNSCNKCNSCGSKCGSCNSCGGDNGCCHRCGGRQGGLGGGAVNDGPADCWGVIGEQAWDFRDTRDADYDPVFGRGQHGGRWFHW